MSVFSSANVAEWMSAYCNPRRLVPVRTVDLHRTEGAGVTIVSDARYQTQIMRLDALAAAVWHLADGHHSVAEIAANLQRRGIWETAGRALAEVLAFCRRLEEQGVLRFLRTQTSSVPLPEPADVLLLTVPDPIHYLPEASGIAENSAPPLGLLALGASLLEAGISVSVCDLNLWGADLDELTAVIASTRPRLVGISVLTAVSEIARCLFARVRRIDSSIVTVAGGPHPTALPEHMLMDGNVDYVVRGEADLTLALLARSVLIGTDVSHLPGISFRRDGHLIHTPDAPPIAVLDDLPDVARELVDSSAYLQTAPFITSRGCRHKCLFCSSVLLNGHKYRSRSVPRVMAEVDTVLSSGTDTLEIQDDDLGSDPERMTAIATGLRARSVAWACQCTVRTLRDNPALAPLLADAGCRQVFCGVESGNDRLLWQLKGVSVADVHSVYGSISESGMKAVASFIIGWPADTEETVEDTVRMALRLRDLGVHTPLSLLTPFPGTALWRDPAAYKITIEDKDFTAYTFSRANVSTAAFSRQDLTAIYMSAVERVSGTYCHNNEDDYA